LPSNHDFLHNYFSQYLLDSFTASCIDQLPLMGAKWSLKSITNYWFEHQWEQLLCLYMQNIEVGLGALSFLKGIEFFYIS